MTTKVEKTDTPKHQLHAGVSSNCPQCNGFGVLFAAFYEYSFKCDLCKGAGVIDDKKMIDIKRGHLLKVWRINQKLTLREAAKKHNIDPSNLSKMERGIIKPVPYYR